MQRFSRNPTIMQTLLFVLRVTIPHGNLCNRCATDSLSKTFVCSRCFYNEDHESSGTEALRPHRSLLDVLGFLERIPPVFRASESLHRGKALTPLHFVSLGFKTCRTCERFCRNRLILNDDCLVCVRSPFVGNACRDMGGVFWLSRP